MWEVASRKISVLLFTSWCIIKSLSSKTTQGVTYFVYILQKKIIGGAVMERDLRKVIGNQLIRNSPSLFS